MAFCMAPLPLGWFCQQREPIEIARTCVRAALQRPRCDVVGTNKKARTKRRNTL